MKKKNIFMGIVGAICFGIGDWLLGYVDATPVIGTAFEYIKVGHGVNYNTARAIIAMALGTIGMLFYYPAFIHMADVVEDKVVRSRLNYMFGATAFAWLVIHYFYGINVYCYAWMMQNGGEVLAGELSKALKNALTWGVVFAYIPLLVPNVVHLLEIIKGKTTSSKAAVFFHPLLWMLILNVVSNILPTSKFSYGLYTFCVNAGMLIWFGYLLFVDARKAKRIIESEKNEDELTRCSANNRM